MSSFPVDDHIPMPNNAGGRVRYPWKQMGIGQSFFVPNIPESTRRGLPSAARYSGIKVVTRNVTENGVPGVRVWRVA